MKILNARILEGRPALFAEDDVLVAVYKSDGMIETFYDTFTPDELVDLGNWAASVRGLATPRPRSEAVDNPASVLGFAPQLIIGTNKNL